jgi:hypothetical protein
MSRILRGAARGSKDIHPTIRDMSRRSDACSLIAEKVGQIGQLLLQEGA